MNSSLLELPHRRLNALTGDWVQVSPHRAQRPWQGQVEAVAADERPPYDPACYLCPGNRRAGGERNPAYTGTYVFTNDFSALQPGAGDGGATPEEKPAREASADLFQIDRAPGTCRVLCFSPRHDLTLAEMTPGDIRAVIDTWAGQVEELSRQYRWVQVFENKGALMGCSNPHPHGQIWAVDALPTEAGKEDRAQRAYWQASGRRLLLDYAEEELRRGERLVVVNDEWLAVVPHWAAWPFETLILPRRPHRHLPALDDRARDALADLLRRLLCRYDNLFETAFPYSMGWHGAPGPGTVEPGDPAADDQAHWQLHGHVYPPLLRSATVRKFMVGYELLAEPQRDLTPEQAAARLRQLPEQHYNQERR
jgi:UDPglucose--hexose-1-phosphate uridylyltransferase